MELSSAKAAYYRIRIILSSRTTFMRMYTTKCHECGSTHDVNSCQLFRRVFQRMWRSFQSQLWRDLKPTWDISCLLSRGMAEKVACGVEASLYWRLCLDWGSVRTHSKLSYTTNTALSNVIHCQRCSMRTLGDHSSLLAKALRQCIAFGKRELSSFSERQSATSSTALLTEKYSQGGGVKDFEERSRSLDLSARWYC